MNVTFNVPDSAVAELNAYAVSIGFLNAKAMTAAYFKAQLLAARTAKLVIPTASVDDVVIS
jgi:hypothetical protein